MKRQLTLMAALLSVSLMIVPASYARSHHKKTENNVSSESTTIKQGKTEQREARKLWEEGTSTSNVEHQRRRKQVAALPTEQPSESHKTAPRGMSLFEQFMHRGSAAGPSTAQTRMPFGENHQGMVYVPGYTRKNGTVVQGYWRHKPHAQG